VLADHNGRQVALLHSSPAGDDSKHAVNRYSQQIVTVVNPADDEAVDRRPCCVERQQFR